MAQILNAPVMNDLRFGLPRLGTVGDYPRARKRSLSHCPIFRSAVTNRGMNSRTEQDQLRGYTAAGSDAAFFEVVRRPTDFAYSVAIRLVGNPHLEEDISQI